ncbi:hypothetical protein WME90_32410 [Sorangium sp. So ce375]|uniref:hypothetical protein n=1 Tax=Sorangium sp. So ce375 TaxID=3133306 RepID=UPI003F5B6D19
MALAEAPLPGRPRVAPRAAAASTPRLAELPHVRAAAAAVAATPAAPEVPTVARAARAVATAVHAPERAQGVTARPRPAPEDDIEALVDKVERKLLRRIAAERDRRGGLG